MEWEDSGGFLGLDTKSVIWFSASGLDLITDSILQLKASFTAAFLSCPTMFE